MSLVVSGGRLIGSGGSLFSTGSTSGPFAHGDLVTINGSGFGTRSDYNFDNYTWFGRRYMHYKWCDFATTFPASGSTQAAFQVAMNGMYPVAAFDFQPDTTSIQLTQQSGGPSKSGKYYRRTGYAFASEGGIGFLTGSTNEPTSTKCYSCWKQRTSNGWSGKMQRFWQNGTGSSGNNWYFGDSAAFRENTWPYDGGAFYANYSPGTVFVRHEAFMDPSSTTKCHFVVGGTLINYSAFIGGNPVSPNPTTLPMTNTSDSGHGLWVEWPNALDTGGTLDDTDVYFDFTWQRVEITDSTKTEIQILNSWADTQIQFTLNQGELTSGSGRTYTVYDNSNNVVGSGSIAIA